MEVEVAVAPAWIGGLNSYQEGFAGLFFWHLEVSGKVLELMDTLPTPESCISTHLGKGQSILR